MIESAPVTCEDARGCRAPAVRWIGFCERHAAEYDDVSLKGVRGKLAEIATDSVKLSREMQSFVERQEGESPAEHGERLAVIVTKFCFFALAKVFCAGLLVGLAAAALLGWIRRG